MQPVSEDPFVNPREMRLVHEVLDLACGAAGADETRRRVGRVARVIELGKRRDVGQFRIREAHPHEAVPLGDAKRARARLERDRAIVLERRDPHASPVRVVLPPVIRADEAAAFHPAERQRRPAVDAQVREAAQLAVETDEHEVLPEQPARTSARDPRSRMGDRVPEAAERRPQIALEGGSRSDVRLVGPRAPRRSSLARSGRDRHPGLAGTPWRRSSRGSGSSSTPGIRTTSGNGCPNGRVASMPITALVNGAGADGSSCPPAAAGTMIRSRSGWDRVRIAHQTLAMS